MALVKGKTTETVEQTEVETVETETVTQEVSTETVTQEVSTDDVNAAIAEAQEAEQEQAVEPEAEKEPEQADEPEQVEKSAEPEAEKAEEPVVESPKVEKKKDTEMPIETKNEVVEDAEIVTGTVETEQKVETEKPETEQKVETEKSETKSELVVADEGTTGTAVAAPKSKEAAAGQVIAAASDAGFEGLELGFGSFAMIKLENEGQFADSDDNELGKHIRAVLQQSTAVYLYKQEDNDDGPIAYSYDRVNLTSYKGSEGDTFKTVDEIRAAWTEEGYDLEEKKYLEVVATIEEDHDEILEGEVPEGLLDLEGETVMFRLAPASLKAFSGKVATLQMRKQPIQGAVMDFLVGKKRKTSNGKTYFPWKFRLVK